MKKFAMLAVILLLKNVANATALPIVPIYNDLWDISNGTVVTANSPVSNSTLKIVDMFGGKKGTWEPGNVIFQDGHVPPYVHFVEWQTTTTVTVQAFNLFAAHDIVPGMEGFRRAFARMRFFYWEQSSWVKFFDAAPIIPYFVPVGGTDPMPFSVILPNTVSSNRWRVEFDQQAWWSDGHYYGPRIIELDAFSTPEPATLLILGLGAAILRRKRSHCS